MLNFFFRHDHVGLASVLCNVMHNKEFIIMYNMTHTPAEGGVIS